MTRMRDPKSGEEKDIAESAVKDFSHIGWVVVPTDGAQAPVTPTPPGLTRVVEEANVLEPGKHIGKIVGVEPRSGVSQKNNKPYAYIDVLLECDGKTVKAGYADTMSPVSMLGKLLGRFGATVMPGDNIDIEGTLMGRTVEFQTTTNAQGYSDVQRETVVPKEGAN